MLVLTRRKNESLIIGDNIVVTIIEVRGDKVRIGIDAPKEVPVCRQEVFEAITRKPMREWFAPESPSCPEEVEFLAAIRANPRDVPLLQVYADWLEDRGDARSERIREHCRWIG